MTSFETGAASWDWSLVRDPLAALSQARPLEAWIHGWLGVSFGGTNTPNGLRKAVESFTKAIALEPDRPWYRAWRCRMRVYLGDPDALRDADQALRLDPPCGWLRAWRGIARLKLGDSRGAKVDLRASIRQYPYYDRAHWWLGEAAAKGRNHAQAVDNFNRAIAINPTMSLFYFGRASALLRIGAGRPFVEDMTRLIDLDDKLVKRLAALRLPAVINLLGRLLKGNPDWAPAWGWRGQAKIQAGDWSGALEDLRRCTGLDKAWPWGQAWTAEARLHTRDLAGALASADAALALNPHLPIFYGLRGQILTALGLNKRAEADFKRFLDLDPKSTEALLWHGRLRLAADSPQSAIADCEQALRLGDPRANAELWALRALARCRLADYSGALGDANAALTQESGNKEALLARAQARRGLGDPQGALADLRALEELS